VFGLFEADSAKKPLQHLNKCSFGVINTTQRRFDLAARRNCNLKGISYAQRQYGRAQEGNPKAKTEGGTQESVKNQETESGDSKGGSTESRAGARSTRAAPPGLALTAVV
jgi:hypothetical protein